MPGMQSAQPVAASADRMNFGPSPENGRRNAEIHPVHTGILFWYCYCRDPSLTGGHPSGAPLTGNAPAYALFFISVTPPG